MAQQCSFWVVPCSRTSMRESIARNLISWDLSLKHQLPIAIARNLSADSTNVDQLQRCSTTIAILLLADESETIAKFVKLVYCWLTLQQRNHCSLCETVGWRHRMLPNFQPVPIVWGAEKPEEAWKRSLCHEPLIFHITEIDIWRRGCWAIELRNRLDMIKDFQEKYLTDKGIAKKHCIQDVAFVYPPPCMDLRKLPSDRYI